MDEGGHADETASVDMVDEFLRHVRVKFGENAGQHSQIEARLGWLFVLVVDSVEQVVGVDSEHESFLVLFLVEQVISVGSRVLDQYLLCNLLLPFAIQVVFEDSFDVDFLRVFDGWKRGGDKVFDSLLVRQVPDLPSQFVIALGYHNLSLVKGLSLEECDSEHFGS